MCFGFLLLHLLEPASALVALVAAIAPTMAVASTVAIAPAVAVASVLVLELATLVTLELATAVMVAHDARLGHVHWLSICVGRLGWVRVSRLGVRGLVRVRWRVCDRRRGGRVATGRWVRLRRVRSMRRRVRLRSRVAMLLRWVLLRRILLRRVGSRLLRRIRGRLLRRIRRRLLLGRIRSWLLLGRVLSLLLRRVCP